MQHKSDKTTRNTFVSRPEIIFYGVLKAKIDDGDGTLP